MKSSITMLLGLSVNSLLLVFPTFLVSLFLAGMTCLFFSLFREVVFFFLLIIEKAGISVSR
ncbi:hypothetical protein [Leptospira licerasiae]|uniref:hypothetical protein n=1 Tax=Leptospira licerasiae TaxID=447106 RepID=UPI0010826263|nr:hypothetical protein [Leptospira licerasiae]TGM86781.1 hypothetical protein EHR05_17740 [Leptospira licerasiae]